MLFDERILRFLAPFMHKLCPCSNNICVISGDCICSMCVLRMHYVRGDKNQWKFIFQTVNYSRSFFLSLFLSLSARHGCHSSNFVFLWGRKIIAWFLIFHFARCGHNTYRFSCCVFDLCAATIAAYWIQSVANNVQSFAEMHHTVDAPYCCLRQRTECKALSPVSSSLCSFLFTLISRNHKNNEYEYWDGS